MFRVQGNNYYKGWELVKPTDNLVQAKNVVDTMDARTYDQYLIIERTKDSDVIIDTGCLDRPKEYNKRKSR